MDARPPGIQTVAGLILRSVGGGGEAANHSFVEKGGLSSRTSALHHIEGVMHQSFVVPVPTGPGNSGAFNFSVFKALLNALHFGDKFIVLLKAPAPPEVDNNEEQQMTWTGFNWPSGFREDI